MQSYLKLNGKVIIKHAALMIIQIIAVTGLISILAITGCGSDDDPAETDRVKKLLTKSSWSIERVTVDGVDKTPSFTELTLQFADTHYTTTHGGVLWSGSDSWKFTDDTGNTIVRGDDIEITIREISNHKLILDLTWTSTTLGPGRMMSVAGEHVFTFSR